jgi:hypothetical protein
MWISYPVFVLAAFCVVAAVIGGGIYTLVFVPLAVIAVVVALVSFAVARAGSDGGGPAPNPPAGIHPPRRMRRGGGSQGAVS